MSATLNNTRPKVRSILALRSFIYSIYLTTIMKLLTLLAVVGFAEGQKKHDIICQSPIKTLVGNDTTISCYVDPFFNLATEVLDFKRDDVNRTIVYSYRGTSRYPGEQAPQYINRTSLNYEDLDRGILTLKISSVQPSDSGTYRIYIPALEAYNRTHIEVVQTDQQNRTIKNESGTTGPPKEDVTEPDNHGAVIAAVVVGVVAVAVAVLIFLVKSGKIRTCLKKCRGMKREERDATNNNYELNNLMDLAKEGEDQRIAAQDGLREVVVADGPSVP